jgi:RNase P/RNase MRP subunit POP5
MVDRRFQRKRYIAFELIGPEPVPGKRCLAKAIDDRLAQVGKKIDFEIIFIKDRRGIILTSHLKARELREILNSSFSNDHRYTLRTLGTSGTILTLKRKFFKGQDV